MNRNLWFSLLVVVVVGCAPNQPWRTDDPSICPENGCKSALIEKHDHFDLAFVEFSERGNVFRREKMQKVLKHVAHKSNTEGVTVIVFVHGWKHNAEPGDKNVVSFRRLLNQTANLIINGELSLEERPRRLVGIYIGWRGQSLEVPLFEELSFWDRKEVAHEVGKGGVTEFLLQLERTVIKEDDPNKNLLLITGHSFGGAIVLSALNEILMERIVAAQPVENGCQLQSKTGCAVCQKGRTFGHGVVLLNPAIEANEALQLKELVSQRCFAFTQDRLMHIISSEDDTPTHLWFPLGQFLGVSLSWSQVEFDRTFGFRTSSQENEAIQFDEFDLDMTTVGNFVPYRTGYLGKEWNYDSCVGEKLDCISSEDLEDKEQHIPVARHEPLAFLYANGDFISGHNDIFNENVAAYLVTIVAEARYKRVRAKGPEVKDLKIPGECWNDVEFDFGACFKKHREIFGSKKQVDSS